MELKAKSSGIISKLHRLINPPREELTGLDIQANLVAFQSPTTDLLTHACLKVGWLFIKSQASASVTYIITSLEYSYYYC
jgi:hypothetical protein